MLKDWLNGVLRKSNPEKFQLQFEVYCGEVLPPLGSPTLSPGHSRAGWEAADLLQFSLGAAKTYSVSLSSVPLIAMDFQLDQPAASQFWLMSWSGLLQATGKLQSA